MAIITGDALGNREPTTTQQIRKAQRARITLRCVVSFKRANFHKYPRMELASFGISGPGFAVCHLIRKGGGLSL